MRVLALWLVVASLLAGPGRLDAATRRGPRPGPRRARASSLLRPLDARRFAHGRTLAGTAGLAARAARYQRAVDVYFQSLEHLAGAGEQAAVDVALTGLFASSEGSEVRLMLMGVKPAVLTNFGGSWARQWREDHPRVSPRAIDSFAVIRASGQYPSVRFAANRIVGGTYEIAYQPALVERVIAAHQETFRKLGYDPAAPVEEIVERAAREDDALAVSLILGYSLRSAILFHLHEMGPRTARRSRSRRYWAGLRALLSPEQLDEVRLLARDPSGQREVLATLVDRPAWRGRHPARARAWERAGLQPMLDHYRRALFGDEPPADLMSMP